MLGKQVTLRKRAFRKAASRVRWEVELRPSPCLLRGPSRGCGSLPSMNSHFCKAGHRTGPRPRGALRPEPQSGLLSTRVGVRQASLTSLLRQT